MISALIRKMAAALALTLSVSATAGILLQEGFENVSILTSQGWVVANASTPVGSTSWFQGNVAPFPAQSGSPNSYIAANYLSTPATGGTISTWLFTPTLALNDGMILSFWTRTDEDIDALFSDRLNVRISTAGTSTMFSDFNTLIASVNPALTPGTGYPAEWTQYSVTLSGLGFGSTGRFAFEYNVPLVDDNQNPVFANYIGLDNVSLVPAPLNAALLMLGLVVMTLSLRRGNARRTLR